MMSHLCTPWGGPSPPKKFVEGGGEIFSHPLGSGGVVQTFPANSPWKGEPRTGFKILGAPPKKFAGRSKLAQISPFSDFFAHFSKMVRDINNLKTDF